MRGKRRLVRGRPPAQLPGQRRGGQQPLARRELLRRSQTLDSQAAELGLHRRTGVQLHRQHARRLVLLRIVVGTFGHQLTVDLQRQIRPAGDEVVLVPLVQPKVGCAGRERQRLDVLLAGGVEHAPLAFERQVMASELVVQPHFPRLAEVVVDLIAAYVPVGQATAAKLKPAVGAGRRRAGKTKLQLQFEIVDQLALPNQILVHRRSVVRRDRTGNRTILDRPEAHVLAAPAIERPPVEDRLEARFVRGRRPSRADRDRHPGRRDHQANRIEPSHGGAITGCLAIGSDAPQRFGASDTRSASASISSRAVSGPTLLTSPYCALLRP